MGELVSTTSVNGYGHDNWRIDMRNPEWQSDQLVKGKLLVRGVVHAEDVLKAEIACTSCERVRAIFV